MTQLGTCTKCRGRTVVTDCAIEAFTGDTHAVTATLCPMCIEGMKVAKVTKRFALKTKNELVVVFQ